MNPFSKLFERVAAAAVQSVAALAFVCALAPQAAQADLEKRIALVVGNGAYVAAPKLENPVNDAKAVSASLKRLGFQVVEGYDLTANEMQTKIGEFSDQIASAKAALVYYAGHGVAFQDDNYLLPVDIVLKTPSDLDLKAINLSVVLKLLKREDAIDIVILDACRNNPFAEALARTSKSRGLFLDGGLASVDTNLARGTLIAFATDPKKTALDGAPGDHSPFTKALLAHLEDSNVPIDTVFNRVRTDVDSATSQAQTPWVNTSLIGEFILNPASPSAVATPLPASAQGSLSGERLALDDKLWAAAEQSNAVEDYQAYIDAVPNGAFVQMAKNRIARAKTQHDVASLDPVAAPTPAPSSAAAPARDATIAETGTKETEDSLNLDVKARKDVEARLMALGFDPGNFTGAFNFKTRATISEWQKRRSAPSTGYLGPLQYAALVRETADMPTVAATPKPAVHAVKKLRKPAADTKVAQPAPAATQAPANDAGSVGAFIGGALLGGALGATIHRY